MDAGIKKDRKPNPRENANLLSALFFCYTVPIFMKGYRKDLEMEDLTQILSEHKSSYLGDRIEAVWNKEVKMATKNKRSPSLRRVLWKLFGFTYVLYAIILLIVELGIKLAQPILLGFVISYYTPGQTEVKEIEVYLYAAGIILCSLVVVLMMHPYLMGVLHLGMKIRISCCSLIYRKALKLSNTAMGQTTVGQMVNLLSNDVSRFDVALVFPHYLVVGPIETLLITYLLYLELGLQALIGVGVILFFIPLQMYLGKRASVLRLKTALRTDERVRLMNEIVSGIQVIKMYAWEKPFAKLIAAIRKYEVKSIRGISYIRGTTMSFMTYTTRISIFFSILLYIVTNNQVDAKQVFVLTSFYNLLRISMSLFFPTAITQTAELKISVERLNKFLLYDENKLIKPNKKNASLNESAISLKNVCVKWLADSSDNTLTDLNLEIERGKLVAVIGSVGAGKSSLFQVILNELPVSNGYVQVNGVMSYSSQETWLFAGSVQQNILFGQEMDKYRYREVVEKCALERDFELFPYGDKTIVGERGVSLSGGQRARINLARAVYKEADIYLLDDPLSAVDTRVGKQLFEKCIRGFLRGKTVALITHQLQYLKEVDDIVILENGVIKAKGSFGELQNSGVDFAKLLGKFEEEEENKRKHSADPRVSIASGSSVGEEMEVPHEIQEQKTIGSVGSYVFREYFKAGGNLCGILVVGFLFVLTQVLGSVSDYFITYWVNLQQERAEQNQRSLLDVINSFDQYTFMYIYLGIIILLIVITFVRTFTFINICMKASRRLHDAMFRSITRATMRFFNTNSSGRILNRFSKDMGTIDELLPAAMMDVLQMGLNILAMIIVVGVVNYWLMIPTLLIGIIFFILRSVYVKTSRDIKRLEGITRSPVYYHLNASLQGLTTIRAFKAQSILEKEFDNHQDLHSSAWYIFLSCARTYAIWLDLFCVIYIAIVTLSFLVMGNEKYGGNVGLAITQAIGLTGMLQWCMRQSAELENQMTSVERILEYTKIDEEPSLESSPDSKPPPQWPEKGEISFVDLYLRYTPEDDPVLRSLNFKINSREKIGIVGRTGAGKSSLITAIFRLANLEGKIIIDDVDITKIGLHDLRSKVSIIPQEPVLFSGTMRKNLDPFGEYEDEVLWKALENVELKKVLGELASGLDSKVNEGGSNFSVGQRQLVCLARAIVRKNKILILDEATANIDPQTDALIQETIRKKFSECTVLTVAHRLNTIMDSDKVLVMDAGQMVEFDRPYVLLENRKYFYQMVQQTGNSMAEVLTNIAKKNYEKFQVV